MSLYLGKIGRRILNYTVKNPRLNRAVDTFGKAAHKATFGRYTTGLTRESLLLFQRTSSGDKIEVRCDGFYRNGDKIAGNELISKRIKDNGLPIVFLRTNEDSAEAIAEYCRLNFKYFTYFKSFTLTAIVTALFSLPDAIFRLAANANMPSWTTELICEGFHRPSNEMIKWKFISAELGESAVNECWENIPKGINNNIEYIASYHYNTVGERTQEFLTNHHHHIPLNSTLDYIHHIFAGPTFLLVASLLAYKLMPNKYLKNIAITSGAMVAANSIVNGYEVLFNGYATNYLNPAGVAFNLADCYGVIGWLGLNITLFLTVYMGIKSKGGLLDK